MTADYRAWSLRVRQLDDALGRLEPAAAAVGVAPPDGENWLELLRMKLIPQLDASPTLVVCVVGGTNIGKSVIFNHLVGETASAVSPLAAGTKHPVCLVPPSEEAGEHGSAVLSRLFEGFRLQAWTSAQDALEDCPDDLLFWRAGKNVPQRLLVLDAPDVDSDAEINWHRARAIRQAADVLIAVLTQQKYNDAAVKRFFREAAAADKPVVVIFNQCDLEADREYWPQWLSTFCGETGARPELVYVAPLDRPATVELRLPFFDVGLDGRSPRGEPAVLREELAALHFDEIKVRTFRGAIGRVLDEETGAAGYLARVRAASGEFSAAGEALSASEMARVAWPTLPSSVLVDEIRHWWDDQRSSWSRSIHGFYRSVGRGATWPVRAVWSTTHTDGEPLEPFRRDECGAIVLAVEKMLDELDRLAQVGNDTLRPRLRTLLGGKARQTLLDRVRQVHAELPAVDDDYRDFLRGELNTWRESNPHVVRFLRSLDHVVALARPAITMSLAISGFVMAGDLVGQAAVQTAGGFATEAAIATGITGGGEMAIGTAGEGVRKAAGRLFLRLQSRYTQQRAQWLATWLEDELLGDLLTELRTGAELPQSDRFREVEKTLESLGTYA